MYGGVWKYNTLRSGMHSAVLLYPRDLSWGQVSREENIHTAWMLGVFACLEQLTYLNFIVNPSNEHFGRRLPAPCRICVTLNRPLLRALIYAEISYWPSYSTGRGLSYFWRTASPRQASAES